MEQEENKKKKGSIVNWLLLIIFLIIIVVVIDSASDTEPAVATNQTETASRCLSVPDWIVTRLNDGLNINGGGSITNLQAVKSDDFGSVYFISGQLQGAGLGRDTDIVTFISNRIGANESGMTFSADAVAVEFSDWPDIATTNLLGDGGVSRGVIISSDGYRESRECVSKS